MNQQISINGHTYYSEQECEEVRVALTLDDVQRSRKVITTVLLQVQAQFKPHKEIVFFSGKRKRKKAP